jgi:hypothetical protein
MDSRSVGMSMDEEPDVVRAHDLINRLGVNVHDLSCFLRFAILAAIASQSRQSVPLRK